MNMMTGDNAEPKKSTRGRRRSKAGRLCSEITLEELNQHFHQSIEVAAVEMRVGVTALKKLCRKFKVSKWPYRKFQRIIRLASVAKAGMARIEDYQRLAELVLDPQLQESCPLWQHIDPSERYVVQAVFAASKTAEFQAGWKAGTGEEGEADEDSSGTSISQAAARIVQQKVLEFAAHAPPPTRPAPNSAANMLAFGQGSLNATGNINHPFMAHALRVTNTDKFQHPQQHVKANEDSSGSNAAALQTIVPHLAAYIQQASLPGNSVSSAMPDKGHSVDHLSADSLPQLLETVLRQASLQHPPMYTSNSNLLPANLQQWNTDLFGVSQQQQGATPFSRPAPFLQHNSQFRQDSLLGTLQRISNENQHNSAGINITQQSLSNLLMGSSLNMASSEEPAMTINQGSLDVVMKSLLQASLPTQDKNDFTGLLDASLIEAFGGAEQVQKLLGGTEASALLANVASSAAPPAPPVQVSDDMQNALAALASQLSQGTHTHPSAQPLSVVVPSGGAN